MGLLTATAAVAVMGNAQTFRSEREFAAYLGLIPKQNGSGGKVKLSGISKNVAAKTGCAANNLSIRHRTGQQSPSQEMSFSLMKVPNIGTLNG